MARPQLVYDDSCGFCIWATEFAVHYGPFEPVSFSEVTAAHRERLPGEYEECAHVLTDEGIYSCGESVEMALTRIFPVLTIVVPILRLLPGYATVRERVYHTISKYRYSLEIVANSEPPAQV